MRRKPNRLGLTLTDYRNALKGYKSINSWAIWGYNGNVPLADMMSSFLSFKKQKREPLRRVRRIGLTTLQNGIQNEINKILLRWARKRMMPEARQWLLARFPHTAEAIKQSEISYSAGSSYGTPQPVASIIAPGYEKLWEQHQAELKKKP